MYEVLVALRNQLDTVSARLKQLEGIGFAITENIGALPAKQMVYFSYTVPEGATSIKFTLTQASGDCDLYVAFNRPADFSADWSSENGDTESDEVIVMSPTPGVYNVAVNAFDAATGVMLNVLCEPLGDSNSTPPPVADPGLPTYTYASAAEAGGSFTSTQLKRSGVHYLKFDTVTLTNGPRDWNKHQFSFNGFATLLVLNTGSNYSTYRMLMPDDSKITWVGNTVDLNGKPEWFEQPGTHGITEAAYSLYFVTNTFGNYQWVPTLISNRRSAQPLGQTVYKANTLYLAPMKFPSNVRINEIMASMIARTKINSADKIYMSLFTTMYNDVNPGSAIASGFTEMGTWTQGDYSFLVNDQRNSEGVNGRRSVTVMGHRLYWIGIAFFPVDPTATITLKSLSLGDAVPICGGDGYTGKSPFDDLPFTAIEMTAYEGNMAIGVDYVGMEMLTHTLPPCIAFRTAVKDVN